MSNTLDLSRVVFTRRRIESDRDRNRNWVHCLYQWYRNWGLRGARGVEKVGKQTRSDPMETALPGKSQSDSRKSVRAWQKTSLSHDAKQAHATREIYVVLKAMRRYKRATHVTLVVLLRHAALCLYQWYRNSGLRGARGVEKVGKQTRSDPMETALPGKSQSDSRKSVRAWQKTSLSHDAKQAHATREIYVVLKAMRRYKRATHVTLVVLLRHAALCLYQWYRNSGLRGARGVEKVGKQTRSDPMETALPGKSQSDSRKSVRAWQKTSLSHDAKQAHATPMESVCRHFPPPPQLYFAVYLLSLSRTDSRQSDGFLPRQPVSIGCDGVRLPTFSTPSSTILCCIFTKSLANWLAAVRWILATTTRLHRIRWSPFADISHPLFNYALLYIY